MIQFLYSWQQRIRQRIGANVYRLRHPKRGTDRSLPPGGGRFDRVLLVIAGLIGDTVMSVPVIIEARRLWPRAQITVLGQKHNCELLSACPLIDRNVQASALPFSLRKKQELRRLQLWLEEEKFDIAILVLGDQFALMAANAAIPVRVGVEGSPLAACLTHAYDIGSPQDWGPAERLNALRCLGLEVRDASPRVWISTEARASSQRKIAELGLEKGEGYVVLHPFGSTQRQWWPIEKGVVLAVRLGEALGLRTLIVGGAETRSHAPTTGLKQVLNAAGLLSLPELCAVLDEASVVVSTDSGPLHIAGALGTPVIGLFRRRRAEHSDRYPSLRAVVGSNESCQSRCQWNRCAEAPCRQMSAISVEEVLGTAEEIVADSAHARTS